MKRLVWLLLCAALFSPSQLFAQTQVVDETEVSAAPFSMPAQLTLGSFLEGYLGFNAETAYSQWFYAQASFNPNDNWRLGTTQFFAYNALENKEFHWILIRLFAEKKNFINLSFRFYLF